MALSDRIAVMRAGKIVQLDTPKRIYEQPADPFVADFIGSSNFLRGQVQQVADGKVSLRLPDGQELTIHSDARLRPGEQAVVVVRPERLRVEPDRTGDASGPNRLRARITERSYLGARWLYTLDTAGQPLRLETEQDLPDGPVVVELPAGHCALFAARRPTFRTRPRIDPIRSRSRLPAGRDTGAGPVAPGLRQHGQPVPGRFRRRGGESGGTRQG